MRDSIPEQLAAGVCWQDRKIWLLSEEEMGSFVMHSSQRHQQTCVERRAASRSRRAPGGGGCFSWETVLCRDFHKQRLQSVTPRLDPQQLQSDWSFTSATYELAFDLCTSQTSSGLKVHTKQLEFKPSHRTHICTLLTFSRDFFCGFNPNAVTQLLMIPALIRTPMMQLFTQPFGYFCLEKLLFPHRKTAQNTTQLIVSDD